MLFANALHETIEIVKTSILRGAVTLGSTLSAAGLITASQGVKLSATAASGVTVLLTDSAGKALLATGETVPSDAGTIYAKGCLFIDTNVATGTTGLYCNKGTAASCVFTAVTQA